jgi:hypothetical protein
MMLAPALAFLRGPFSAGLAAVPRWVWHLLAALLVLLALWRWHESRLAEAAAAARADQASADRAAFARASAAAAEAQTALAGRVAGQQTRISKGTDDALRRDHDDLARRYDDLRLRWVAHRAAEGNPGDHHPAAVSGAAPGAAAADCAAAGWVSFDTAAAAAEAADRAIAKDDAWIAWVSAQAEAWPKE